MTKKKKNKTNHNKTSINGGRILKKDNNNKNHSSIKNEITRNKTDDFKKEGDDKDAKRNKRQHDVDATDSAFEPASKTIKTSYNKINRHNPVEQIVSDDNNEDINSHIGETEYITDNDYFNSVNINDVYDKIEEFKSKLEIYDLSRNEFAINTTCIKDIKRLYSKNKKHIDCTNTRLYDFNWQDVMAKIDNKEQFKLNRFLINFCDYIEKGFATVRHNFLLMEEFLLSTLKRLAVISLPSTIYYLYATFSPFINYREWGLMFPRIDPFLIFNFLIKVKKSNKMNFLFENKFAYPTFKRIFFEYYDYDTFTIFSFLKNQEMQVEEAIFNNFDEFTNDRNSDKFVNNLYENIYAHEKLQFIREEPKLSKYQNKVLIGLLLGDGNLSSTDGNYKFIFHQGTVHSYYFNIVSSIFCNVINECGIQSVDVKTETCQFQFTIPMEEIYNSWYVDRVKVVPHYIEEYFDETCVIFWLCDDGSCGNGTSGSTHSVRFLTQCFSDEDVLFLVSLLNTLQVNAKVLSVSSTNDQNVLMANADDLRRLIMWMPESMAYKLYDDKQKQKCEELNNCPVMEVWAQRLKSTLLISKEGTTPPEHKYMCRVCKFISTKRRADNHMTDHFGSIACSDCNAKFSRNDKYLKHVNRDTKNGNCCDKLFRECETCYRWFAQDGISNHIGKHNAAFKKLLNK